MGGHEMSKGGARPGAGRKCLAREQRKVSVTISIPWETARILHELRQEKVPVNEILANRIQTLYQDFLEFQNL